MRVIAEFPIHSSRAKRYDWDLIFDGHTRELEPGIDFCCEPSSLVSTAREAARRRGISLDVRIYPRDDDQQVVVGVKAHGVA